LLDILPGQSFSFNGNGPGASGSLQYHFLLADFFTSRHLATFDFTTFWMANGFHPFPSGLPHDLMRRLLSYRFIGAFFSQHDLVPLFSLYPVCNAGNFFLPVAFDITQLFITWKLCLQFAVCSLLDMILLSHYQVRLGLFCLLFRHCAILWLRNLDCARCLAIHPSRLLPLLA
jgi:hypothetical protein